MATQTYPTGAKTVSPAAGLVPIANAGSEVAQFNVAGGAVTLTDSTPVTVANKAVTAHSTIVFTLKTVGGTVGAIPVIDTITPGTGFTVSGGASDTSTYNYLIIG